MLHTVIPLSVIFPEGDYPCEQGHWGKVEIKCEAQPSTDLKDYLNRGE